MSERSIESFFTKISTPKKDKVTGSTSQSITTVSVTQPLSDSKRRRDELPADDGEAVTLDDDSSGSKRAKQEAAPPASSSSSSSSSSPTAVLTADSSTVTTAADGSSATSTQHWTASLASLLHPSWYAHLKSEFSKPYFTRLCASLLKASLPSSPPVFPPPPLIFSAFSLTPFNSVSVVIIGQDPYHAERQAHGLAFSVPPSEKIPSSLRNIYAELSKDIPGFRRPQHGNLSRWAEQGVLLLNTSLTVTAGQPTSHSAFGWEQFTDAAISALSREGPEGLVFLLWGKHAQKKKLLIRGGRHHHVLEAPHPSGLSASRGFFGCKHFSKCNELLKQEGKKEIDWQV